VAWMRMMGAESVAYHRATVLERGDDHPRQALAYYASRGETPMVWGGSGARSMDLAGAVSGDAYERLFGRGGACHPATGTRLVTALRPGMELVISAHKSVAELGVIGRAEDMHSIMDAERDATLAYLDLVTRTSGGRRGRASSTTPTAGLIYAHTRHATSRSGNPCPHDHVLLANVVEMLDERGGWKAANTSLWREHLHAATVYGRVAAAHKAVELGYGIEIDDGPSGRLRHWRVAGIPDEILDLHSSRAAEISMAVEARGDDSYRARQVAARATRAAKEHRPQGELVARWQAELTGAGWPPGRLLASDEAASHFRIAGPVDRRAPREIVARVLHGDGELVRRKVFSRRHLIVELAPPPLRRRPPQRRQPGQPGSRRPTGGATGGGGRNDRAGVHLGVGPGPRAHHRRDPGTSTGPHRQPHPPPRGRRRGRPDRGQHRGRPQPRAAPGRQAPRRVTEDQ
jgi:conjugative relaxase-like TrwC/TraI family protein